jgi:hypothetical protein
VLGAAALIACAVTVFALAAGPVGDELTAAGPPPSSPQELARAQRGFHDREGLGTARRTNSFAIMVGFGRCAACVVAGTGVITDRANPGDQRSAQK